MAENANSGVQKGDVIHGARAWVSINGRNVGYCQNITVTTAVDRQPVEVLDDIEVQEHVATAYRISGTISTLKLARRTLVELGLERDVESLTVAAPLTITISDRPTDKALWTIEEVSPTGASFTLQKGMLTAENVNFVAIRKRDKNGLIC